MARWDSQTIKAPKELLGRRQGKALSSLIREAPPPLVRERLNPLEQLALLKDRYRELAEPEASPVKRSFREFCRHCVWTKDEAGGGEVRKCPDWPFLDELADHLILRPQQMWEKSRRVFASWFACAFDVWVAAGGQDPRWVAERMNPETGLMETIRVLMQSDRNRTVAVVARKYEDSCKFLKERHKFIVEQFFAHNCLSVWPDFPEWRFIENKAEASNGSTIEAFAQGADQLRGWAYTLVHIEEFAFWEFAQQTLEASSPTTLGGGHIVAITTPQAGSYAQKVRDGRINAVA